MLPEGYCNHGEGAEGKAGGVDVLCASMRNIRMLTFSAFENNSVRCMALCLLCF